MFWVVRVGVGMRFRVLGVVGCMYRVEVGCYWVVWGI